MTRGLPADSANPGSYEFWSALIVGISRDRLIFVADREHLRMQVFDEDGYFLEIWPTGYDLQILARLGSDDQQPRLTIT